MSLTIFFAAVLATQSVTKKSPPARPSWQWTTEERLRDRFDADKVRERDVAYEALHPEIRAQAARVQPESGPPADPHAFVYRIDGTRNPELFLPHELFDALLTGLQPDTELAAKRAFYNRSLNKAGFDPTTFWPALESVSASYLPMRFSAGAQARCRERFVALEAARETFGRQTFDALLYSVIAPTMQFSESTTDPDPVAALLRADRGCQ